MLGSLKSTMLLCITHGFLPCFLLYLNKREDRMIIFLKHFNGDWDGSRACSEANQELFLSCNNYLNIYFYYYHHILKSSCGLMIFSFFLQIFFLLIHKFIYFIEQYISCYFAKHLYITCFNINIFNCYYYHCILKISYGLIYIVAGKK